MRYKARHLLLLRKTQATICPCTILFPVPTHPVKRQFGMEDLLGLMQCSHPGIRLVLTQDLMQIQG